MSKRSLTVRTVRLRDLAPTRALSIGATAGWSRGDAWTKIRVEAGPESSCSVYVLDPQDGLLNGVYVVAPAGKHTRASRCAQAVYHRVPSAACRRHGTNGYRNDCAGCRGATLDKARACGDAVDAEAGHL